MSVRKRNTKGANHWTAPKAKAVKPRNRPLIGTTRIKINSSARKVNGKMVPMRIPKRALLKSEANGINSMAPI